jgi:tetratricopeptide (TPR) repeat protein
MTARRIIVLSALWLVLVTGCQSGEGSGDRGGAGRYDRVVLRYGVELPPGIPTDSISPLTGERLAKAKLLTGDVLAGLARPGYLDADVQPDAEVEAGAARTEPPLAAQKAYVTGRGAWRKGDIAGAKKQLESALRLAPNEPTLLRILGEIYTRSGNRIKGAQYFRRAVDIDPDDAHSLFILGRFAVEKGDRGEAAVLFHEVLTREPANPALTELAYHFLGNTLRTMGHATAAIEQFDRYIELASRPARPSLYARDQMLLRRQIGVTRQLLGDLYMNLDRPGRALDVYALALEAGVPDAVKLDKRRVYAALRLSDQDLAERIVIEQVQRHQGDAQSLAMVRYIVNQGVSAASLAQALRSVYESQGRPEALAIATADVLPTDKARGFLIDHLTQAPEDRRAFYTLLRSYLLPEDQSPHDTDALVQAIDLTAGLMSKAPDMADEYGSTLVTHTQRTQGSETLLEAIGSGDMDGLDGTMRIVLRGLCLAVLERFEEAQAQFEVAVEREPDLAVARVELAKALIVQDEYDAAVEVLEPLSGSSHAGVILLRSSVLAKTGKTQEAVELIDRVIRDTGGDARLVISKANLELNLGRVKDAERTLQDALNAEPKSELLYAALLDLYDPAPGRVSPIEDQTAKWRVLVKRLLGTIPNSRTGRLVQAQLHEASRNYDRAATILEGLLAENPNDGKALSQLLDTYHAAGRTGEAIALLEDRLQANPDDLRLLRMAMRFYTSAGNQEKLFEVQEHVLLLEPAGSIRASQLGFLYRRWGKFQKAVDVLEAALGKQEVETPIVLVSLLASTLSDMEKPDLAERRITKAIERFPEHEAELTYLLAMTATGRGEQERGEQIMRELLAKFPDHGPTNNGLGYAMLMRNEDPGKALEMIRRAVDGAPASEAYMDSLGWAYYKLRRFEDAEVWLRKAREAAMVRVRAEGAGGVGTATLAIISDHLGDTLYRLGREPESLRAWSGAAAHLRGAKPEELKQDPELASLAGRLRAKIAAVRAKTPVPVADLPPEDAAEEGAEDAPVEALEVEEPLAEELVAEQPVLREEGAERPAESVESKPIEDGSKRP